MSDDFLKAIIIPIPKKQANKLWEEYRTLSLLLHAPEILIKIVYTKVQNKIKINIADDQLGLEATMGLEKHSYDLV